MPTNLKEFLGGIGLQQYYNKFVEEGVDSLSSFVALNDSLFNHLGVKMKDRKTLKRAIKTLLKQELKQFLVGIGLQQYYNKFLEEGFDSLSSFVALNDSLFNHLGVKLKDRNSIREALKKLLQEQEEKKEKEEEKKQLPLILETKEEIKTGTEKELPSAKEIDVTQPTEESSRAGSSSGSRKVSKKKATTTTKKKKKEEDPKAPQKVMLYDKVVSIFIGVNGYKNLFSLRGPENDVEELREVCKKMEIEEHAVLKGSEATKHKIDACFDNLRQKLAGEDEEETEKLSNSLVLVFFAGHGHQNNEGQQTTYHLCCQDFDIDNLSQTSINLHNLKNEVASFNCKHVLFFLDCCFSGGIMEEEQIPLQPSQSILVNNFHKGIWAITAGGKKEVKEREFDGEVRGVFSFYLQRAISFAGNEDETSLFSETKQMVLLSQSRDGERSKICVINPEEIKNWIADEMMRNKDSENIPQAKSLTATKLIGVPYLAKSMKDYEITTTGLQISNAKNIAEEEKKKIENFNPLDLVKKNESLMEDVLQQMKEMKDALNLSQKALKTTQIPPVIASFEEQSRDFWISLFTVDNVLLSAPWDDFSQILSIFIEQNLKIELSEAIVLCESLKNEFQIKEDGKIHAVNFKMIVEPNLKAFLTNKLKNFKKETSKINENLEEQKKKEEKVLKKKEANELYEKAVKFAEGKGVEKDMKKANEFYQKSADLGNLDAMVNLGNSYLEGNGLPKDVNKANQLYQKAADLGNANAIFKLGWNYENGIGILKDRKKANQLYQKAADLGNAWALNNLGISYLEGNGVEKDVNKANELFQKAADLGNPNSIFKLGWHYENGIGLTKDLKKANEMYQKAADLGNTWAMNNLGWNYQNGYGVEKDIKIANELLQKASDLGNPRAMNNLANNYRDGNGVVKDYKKANELYEKAIELGEAFAMNNLANNYRDGNGVKKDFKKMNELYEKAVALGNSYAMNCLGWSYQTGRGVEEDYKKANELFQKASDLGNSTAMNNLANNYRDGNGLPKDYKKANELYQKSSDLGSSHAWFQLGVHYLNGFGVEKNFQKAKELLEKAEKAGNEMSLTKLALIHFLGLGVEKNISKGMVYLKKAAEKEENEAKDFLENFSEENSFEKFEKCVSSGKCTKTFTKKKYFPQVLYNCFTCKLTDSLGVCGVCAKKCHKGHNLSEAFYDFTHCDEEKSKCLCFKK